MPMTPEERDRLEALSIPCLEKIHAQRIASHAAREKLGLGAFEPIVGNQRMENCAVSWRGADGEQRSEAGCVVIVYGNSATVYLPNLGLVHRRLGAPDFEVTRETLRKA